MTIGRLTRDQFEAVVGRVTATRKDRAAVQARLRSGELPTDIEAKEVVRRAGWLGAGELLSDRKRLERILGETNLVPAAMLERAARAGQAVARVQIRDARGLVGFGTGFMVSPSLFMTNNHVLQSSEVAASSRIELNFQDGVDGRPLPVSLFDLDPGSFFETDAELDFTIVAVRTSGAMLASLAPFGFCRLIPAPAKTAMGEYLNIVQHPDGDPKQVALRENRLVARLEDFLHYETDTAPGSSGAPVFNDRWEVVALHHAGVPAQNGKGEILSLDGTVWKSEMGEQRIKWIANEGTRISKICERLKAIAASGTQQRLLSELFNPPEAGGGEMAAPPPQAIPGTSDPDGPRGMPSTLPDVSGSTVTWTIPLRVSIDLGHLEVPATPTPRPTAGGAPPLPPAAEAELAEALAEARRARTLPYYAANDDARDRARYYEGIELTSTNLYADLRELLQRTHARRLTYKPAIHVYPWLDLQPNLKLKSVYSGKEYAPEDIIREDFRIEAARAARAAELVRKEGLSTSEALTLLEASLPYNCEHVVPQSWFGKAEPMRGDLHHLFACESGCNSFRGNTPYFDFADFEEAIRSDCGKREGNRFEPGQGKGVVARAVLYFLVRYPGEINATSKEYERSRIETLLDWHRLHPATDYERHRNSVAFRKQGNRNPFIDFPEIAEQIDLGDGLG